MHQTRAARVGDVERGKRVLILVDGETIAAHEGEMLAGALMAAGIWRLRRSPTAHAPRGAFCLMGVCQECAIVIDGEIRPACQVTVREGLRVELRGVP
jgi:predicted molibdopterin-dependent oxidoreductase YjgC